MLRLRTSKLYIFIVLLMQFLSFTYVSADVHVPDTDDTMVYFYTDTCPFCRAQGQFLDNLLEKYPEVNIARFNMSDRSSFPVLNSVTEMYPDSMRFRGSVPLTFYRGEFFAGFNEDVAKQIRALALEYLDELSHDVEDVTNVKELENFEEPKSIEKAETDTIKSDVDDNKVADDGVGENVEVPFIGEVDTTNMSAPILAGVLGIIDGFNVCSVGALVLILSIVLKFRDRKLIIIYGSIFITVTALMYFLLVLIWYKVFKYISPQLEFFEFIVGAIAIAGGVYFLREFIRFKQHGVTCESGTNKAVTSVTKYLQNAVATGNHWYIALAVAVFAIVVVLIEFPCSAAVPMALTATLATMELSTAGYLGSLGIFIFFYLLDELIIFFIAVWSMKIWINSNTFITYASLVGALILFAFGFYYIFI